MKIIVQDPLTTVLRIDQGEEVLQTIKEFCVEDEITAAAFSGIGAARHITLSWYDLQKKEYVDRELEGQFEIASFSGNVSSADDTVHVHAHGVFADQSMQAVAGHVKKLVVGATCELTLTVIEGMMERAHDDRTGLWLLCPQE